MAILSSCSESEDLGSNEIEPQTYNVSGKVEKGPFVSGSTITIQPMDGHLQGLGSMYSSTIQDHEGSFSFGSKSFDSPYAELTATGYFFNEVEGELSEGMLTLKALVDLSDNATVNVNILTHLKYQRIQKLVAGGEKFAEANKQAQEELFAAFGLSDYAEVDASSYSITEGTDESAALIAISSMLLADRSEAELTEYLSKLSSEFSAEGKFTAATKQEMKDDRKYLSKKLDDIKANVISRYENLGVNVDVKELTRYFDWDDDGKAGNETLQAGEQVTLDVTELQVPNEGGMYKVHITSPIPLYLEQPKDDWDGPVDVITPETFFKEMYDGLMDEDVAFEKRLENNVLTLQLSPLRARKPKSLSVNLYDCLGNVMGTVRITQEGDKNMPLPRLGRDAKSVVASIASQLGQAFSELNFIHQHYHYNKDFATVKQLSSSSSVIENPWETFWRSNNNLLFFKEAESRELGVWKHYFNTFFAMYYYYMVTAWGNIPYIDHRINLEESLNIVQVSQNKILDNLTDSLKLAVDNLEEKRNESLSSDANDYFFLSKDVARILLADIYMYRGNYTEAEKLLGKVVSNGYYSLDASNYSDKQTITNLWNNGSGREIIFASKYEILTRAEITLGHPSVVPVMNYTEVMLSYAEALYKTGNEPEAKKRLGEVLNAKGISVSDRDLITQITEARMQLLLYGLGNWAFLKRNGLGEKVYGVETYRLLLPIPWTEIDVNPNFTQNPGY